MITSTYCAIIALIFITLSINVINGRRKFDSPLGDSSNFEMLRRIRAQSNLAEYSPIFIILLTFAEYQGLRSLAVHFFGIIFIIGRFMHAYSLLKAEEYDSQKKLTKNPIWRIRGMMITFFSIGSLILIVLAQKVLN